MTEDIVIHILSYFSNDAYFWRKYSYLDKSSKQPVKLYFKWKVNQSLQNTLVKDIEKTLATQFISEEHDDKYPIIISPTNDDADVVIIFEENGNSLDYELFIKGEMQGTGGFSLGNE